MKQLLFKKVKRISLLGSCFCMLETIFKAPKSWRTFAGSFFILPHLILQTTS